MQFSRKSTVWIFDKKPPQPTPPRSSLANGLPPRYCEVRKELAHRAVIFGKKPLGRWAAVVATELVQSRIKLGSFKGKFTGKPYIWWGKSWFPVDFPWSQSIDRKNNIADPRFHECSRTNPVRFSQSGGKPWKAKTQFDTCCLLHQILLVAPPDFRNSFSLGLTLLKNIGRIRRNCWLDHLYLDGNDPNPSKSIQSSWNDPSWTHQGLRSSTWCTCRTPRKLGTCWCVARRASSTMRLIKSDWGCLNLSGSGVICSYCCYCHNYSFLQLLNCYKSIQYRDYDWLCSQLQLAQHDAWGHIFHKSAHCSSGHPQGSWLSRAPQCVPGTAVVFCSVSAEARPAKVVGVEPFGPSNDLRYADLVKENLSGTWWLYISTICGSRRSPILWWFGQISEAFFYFMGWSLLMLPSDTLWFTSFW